MIEVAVSMLITGKTSVVSYLDYNIHLSLVNNGNLVISWLIMKVVVLEVSSVNSVMDGKKLSIIL
jgi:hypothetical protein